MADPAGDLNGAVRTIARGAGRWDVVIDRPGKRNALSAAMLAALGDAFRALATDETLRVVVLRGAGDRSFAAGGDLREVEAIRDRDGAIRFSRTARAALDAVRSCPVPVVAGLNGDALGGGAELAVACDIRVAAAHTRIGFVQGRLGITTGWGGGADLQDLLGPSRALRLLSAAAIHDAPTCLALGLVDAVAGAGEDLDGAIQRVCEPILARPPQVLRAYKAARIARRDGAARAAVDEAETAGFAECWIHDDHWRAADAALPRRSP